MCNIVRNFLLWKKGEKHQKLAPPRQKKKKKTPNLTKRGKSNILAPGLIIRILTVILIPLP